MTGGAAIGASGSSGCFGVVPSRFGGFISFKEENIGVSVSHISLKVILALCQHVRDIGWFDETLNKATQNKMALGKDDGEMTKF